MTVVWDLEKATVKEVLSHLQKERTFAYTTVATVMKILEQKGFLACLKESYAHVFVPRISKHDYEGACLQHVVTNVFDGEPIALVHRLLDAKKLNQSEIQEIENILNNLKKINTKDKK